MRWRPDCNLRLVSAPGEGRRRRHLFGAHGKDRLQPLLEGLRLRRRHQHDAQHNPKSGGEHVSCLACLMKSNGAHG
jgi:hypothetical protein